MLAILMRDAQVPILLTRPQDASERFEARLRAEGITAPVVFSPVLRIEPSVVSLPARMAGAIFTSKNGVASVEGRGLPAWCVGEATAAAANAKGWQARAAGGDAESLLRRILADAPRGPLVHFRGAHARGDVAARLQEAGIETMDMVVYRQEAEPLNAEAKELLGREKPLILPLFSPRSAAQVAKAGPFHAPLFIVAMSEAVAEEARSLSPRRMIVTPEPHADFMVAGIKQFADAACRIETDGDSA
ncbi:uroporphyrinogen-III synthase [Shimia sp. FJ5]|uniref:uroporphyrinogen-III synthase n=1 Tax=Shimia sp. FJ5 TaxID=3079054 RepID=UPI0026287D9D|nr:uroporphyrinogen-III synthase [Shimia sp. FJ5]MDV4144693.1 uroporphyrinogen-III synthase [Shimia sp. FJ5]